MKIKVKDIAKAAGVSPATVSLVLNNKPSRIAEDTKEHIFRVAREMQFQKESEIDFTEFKKVKTIGLLIPDEMISFYHQLAEDIAKCAFLYGYTVFQCYTSDDILCFYAAIESFMSKNVDGIIAIPPRTMDKENVKLLKSVQKSGVPMILLDRAAYGVFCDFVTADNGWEVPKTIEELETVMDQALAKGMYASVTGNKGWKPVNENYTTLRKRL